MLDLNDAGPQMAPVGDLIPDGTFCTLRLALRPGGVDGPAAEDKGLLKASQSSDVTLLDCAFTVVGGRFDRRKVWQLLTVAGGKRDASGQSIGWTITKALIRAMVESAAGIHPKDRSPQARQARTLPSLTALEGLTFHARIMVEPASSPAYRDQNKLANVVVPGDPEYDALVRGEAVPPRPVDARPRPPRATATAAATAATTGPAGWASAPPGAAQGGGLKPSWL